MPERAFLIDVIGWEWNCSQHITPRFTEAEISAAIKPMAAELGQSSPLEVAGAPGA